MSTVVDDGEDADRLTGRIVARLELLAEIVDATLLQLERVGRPQTVARRSIRDSNALWTTLHEHSSRTASSMAPTVKPGLVPTRICHVLPVARYGRSSAPRRPARTASGLGIPPPFQCSDVMQNRARIATHALGDLLVGQRLVERQAEDAPTQRMAQCAQLRERCVAHLGRRAECREDKVMDKSPSVE